MNGKWIKFPHGKVWLVDEIGLARGSVIVPNDYEDIESLTDAISEAVTDSSVGLTGFAYQHLGCDIFSFTGDVAEMISNDDEVVEIAEDSVDLREALMAQYGLLDIEIDHALGNLDSGYSDESVLQIHGTHRAIHCPSFPEECTYVRVVVGGHLEVGYWVVDEWGESPAEVMGAIIGAAMGGKQ